MQSSDKQNMTIKQFIDICAQKVIQRYISLEFFIEMTFIS
jgi:hypothetical protein